MDAGERLKIRAFVGQLLGGRDDHRAFGDAESLIKAGRLDSLAVVKLVTFLEAEFAVNFDEVEFDPERFDTVESVGTMVEEARR